MIASRIMLACLLPSPVCMLAQAPINEKVKVEFSSPVAMGDKLLAPGKYEIQRLSTANNPLIFEVVSEEGTRTEVTASAIPLVDNLARRPTSVVLGNKGNRQYVRQLWIAGETYGYEFREPDQIEQAAAPAAGGDTRLTATYKADTQAADRAAQLAAERKREEDRLRAEGERQARAELELKRQQEAERAAAERAAAERAERERQQQIAQAKPAEPAPQPQPQPPPAKTGGARQMPKTADGWPTLVFAGLALFGAGLLARRWAY